MKEHHLSRTNPSSRTSVGRTPDPLQPRPFAPAQAPDSLALEPSGAVPEAAPRTFSIQDPSGTSRVSIQPKLTIGAPGDPYEQEADRVASQVVQTINAPQTNTPQANAPLQRDSLEEDELQMKPMLQRDMSEEDELQMKATLQRHSSEEDELQMKPSAAVESGGPASDALESDINRARAGGQPLAPDLQQSMGQAMGADFSQVRVHTNSQSDHLNRSIQAIAFTTGQDVFFRQGAYQPKSRSGQELIAHELTHVVQQNGSAVQRHPAHDEKIHRQMNHGQWAIHRKTDRCGCSACQGYANKRIQRQTSAKMVSQWQTLNAPLQRQIQGQVIQRDLTSTHNNSCRCLRCAGSQVQIQRQTNTGHDAKCQCPQCTGQKQNIQRHPEKNGWAQRRLEEAHSANPEVGPIVIQSSSGNAANVVQRHTAYEHYLLGQVEPSKLADLPMVREIPTLEKEFDKISKEIQKAQSTNRLAEALTLYNKLNEAKQKKEDVRHTIEQEMNRLWTFKSNPEVMKNQENDIGKVVKDQDDKWQVPVVKIPVKGDGDNAVAGDTSIIVSYSEINTFPDFFGNPETIANTPKTKVLNLLQGVRQQSYVELSNMYKEIFGEDKNKLSDWSNREYLGITQGDFQGAVGPRGQAVNEWAYEKRTELQVQGATKRSKDSEKSQEYFAALERNACHFAPYSWTQWEAYHRRARDLARRCAEDKEMVAELRRFNGDEGDIKDLEQEALEFGNQALLQNAFGEHYLQDSFAAGHLIDKTGVMQAFTKWVNQNGKELGSFKDSKAQWAMASMIANKQGTANDLESNPQMLDDQMMRGELNSVGQAVESVGLGATEDITFMMWWRNAANAKSANKHLTPAQALNG